MLVWLQLPKLVCPPLRTVSATMRSEKAMPNTPTLAGLADDLENGRTTARKLVDECLARITDASGEGARAFIHVDAEPAIEAAEAMDRLREVKAAPSRYAGIPISIKDLFDIQGQVSRAGSRALEDSPPAEADAPAVARLRRAGFVVIANQLFSDDVIVRMIAGIEDAAAFTLAAG